MLEAFDQVELELVEEAAHSAGLSSVHPRARAEGMRQVRAITAPLLEYTMVVMQHQYRTVPKVEDFIHAIQVLHSQSAGLQNEIVFLEFGDSDDDDATNDPDYEESDEEDSVDDDDDDDDECSDDASLFDEESESSDGLGSSSNSRDEGSNHDNDDDDDDDDAFGGATGVDEISPLTNVSSSGRKLLTAAVQKYLRLMCGKLMAFHSSIAEEYITFVSAQLVKSFHGEPCLLSRLSCPSLGLVHDLLCYAGQRQVVVDSSSKPQAVVAAVDKLLDQLSSARARRPEQPFSTGGTTSSAEEGSSFAGLEAVGALAKELHSSAAQIASMQQELNREREVVLNLNEKDRKVRELVGQLKNVVDLDAMGVGLLRELSRSAMHPDLNSSARWPTTASSADRTIAYGYHDDRDQWDSYLERHTHATTRSMHLDKSDDDKEQDIHDESDRSAHDFALPISQEDRENVDPTRLLKRRIGATHGERTASTSSKRARRAFTEDSNDERESSQRSQQRARMRSTAPS